MCRLVVVALVGDDGLRQENPLCRQSRVNSVVPYLAS